MITVEIRDGDAAGTVIVLNDIEDVAMAYRCHGDGAWRVLTRGPFASVKGMVTGLAGKAMSNPAVFGVITGLLQRK